jgi:hypothetical protein
VPERRPSLPAIAAAGREVSIGVIAALLAVTRRRGRSITPLLAGLNLSETDLRNPLRRVSWDDFVTLLDRIADATGGVAGLEEIAREQIRCSRFLGLLAGQLLSLRRLHLFGVTISRATCRNLGISAEHLRDGRLRIAYVIPEPYRAASASPTPRWEPSAPILSSWDTRKLRSRPI